ncbi:hypothetical protein SBADM41S_12025 [Streptomyces badius]
MRGEKLSARVVPSIPNFPVAQSANRSKAWVRIGTSLGTPVDPEVVRVSRDSAGSGTRTSAAADRLLPHQAHTAAGDRRGRQRAVGLGGERGQGGGAQTGEGTRVLIP